MNELFNNDYNLDALIRVKPAGDSFTMNVTPRFAPVYEGGYEPLSTRIVKMHLAQKDLFIDVGAHYGYYSLLAAEANERIKILSIEPIAENFKLLQDNLTYNGISHERATCIQAAVSSKSGTTSFFKSEASDNGSLYAHPSSETLAKINIATVCLDDLIHTEKAQRIFIKSDTDGHELEVLRGLSKTLATCDDITLLLEMNPKMMIISGTSTGEIIDTLYDKGFKVFAIDDLDARLYPLDKADTIAMMEAKFVTSYYNILCIKRPKALSVVLFSHSALLGGAERSMLDLVRGLMERGTVCTTVSPSPGPLREELIQLGCAVYVPPGFMPDSTGWWWTNTPSGTPQAALAQTSKLAMEVILPELRILSPDIIFSQTIVSPWGALCAEAMELPHVLSAREYGEIDHHLSFTLGFQPSMTALYKSSEAVFCISEDVKNTLFKDDIDHKTDVVYSHIKISPDVPNTPFSNRSPCTDHVVPMIGIFGSIVRSKGQSDLVHACLELNKRGERIKCMLVGHMPDPTYVEELKKDIAASGYSDQFTWTGYTPTPYALMRQMDIIVSCAQNEALGRTLIEGILLNKPILYANSGGPKEIFIHGLHGLAYPPGDPITLANMIETVLHDKTGAETRAQCAKDYVLHRFTDENYAGRIYAKLVQIVLQKGRSDNSRKAVGRLLMESDIGAFKKASPTIPTDETKLFTADHQNICSQNLTLSAHLLTLEEELSNVTYRLQALEDSPVICHNSLFRGLPSRSHPPLAICSDADITEDLPSALLNISERYGTEIHRLEQHMRSLEEHLMTISHLLREIRQQVHQVQTPCLNAQAPHEAEPLSSAAQRLQLIENSLSWRCLERVQRLIDPILLPALKLWNRLAQRLKLSLVFISVLACTKT